MSRYLKSRLKTIFLALFVTFFVTEHATGFRVENNPYRHREELGEGKYILEWLIELEERRVTFNITAETKGFIGFGLNRKAQMDGADLVIGGVMPNGKPYLSDRHIVGRELKVDSSQDYRLLSARETDTHTFLSFSRAFDTCDGENDLELEVEGDVVSVIWAFGEDDEASYHFQFRGTFDGYILDPDLVPREIEQSPPFGNYIDGNIASVGNWRVWTIAKSEPVPAQDTAYICTIHKAPKHNRKLHMVGFRTVLEGETEHRHIHHYLLHRCRPPQGVDANEFFGPWLSNPGEECYVSYLPPTLSDMPYHYCQEVAHVWGVGGQSNFYPGHVGYPMTEETDDEYYLFQVHYDNRDKLTGLNVRFALEVFYTENLRKHDAGVLLTGTAVPGSPDILIPPSSINYPIYGHCGSSCTNHIFPPKGINIFAAFQHTHLAGRGLRSKHVRNGRDLPLIIHDDNYNFNYQQIRTLNQERTVLPGDSIIIRCTYETTDRGNNVTVGGYRTRHEMCSTIIFYYPYIRSGTHGLCSSELRSEVYREFLGIRNMTWSDQEIEYVVTSPRRNAGLLVSEVGNNIRWTKERRRQLNQMQKTLPQITLCPDQVPGGERNEFESVYVDNEDQTEEEPSKVCNGK